MNLLVRFAILLALGGAALGAGAWARGRYLPGGDTLPGLKVDGALVQGDVAGLVHERAQALLDRQVRLVSGADGALLETRTLGQLGVHVDEAAVVARARALGHQGDMLQRAHLEERARAGELDVPLEPSVDADAVVAAIVPFKETLDRAPVSARLDLDERKVIAGKPGRYLDAYGAAEAVGAAARDAGASEVHVPVVAVAPRVSADFVRSIDIHVVLAEYSTYFSRAGGQKRRGENIDVGASKLDGLVLSPGEIVSFNQVVGDRSLENGFHKSWEIFKGEMVEGIGGGTCQVASTLHAAALFAGLEVLERLPHSRPLGYIPMGLDATVVYPIVDLKLRDPYDFPVVLHARTEGNKLTMQLLGAAKPKKVTFTREVVGTRPFGRTVEENDRLSGETVMVKQHGIRGFKVERHRTIVDADGTRREEKNVDVYPPTNEVYAVPPGFDVSQLPPLPGQADDDDDDASDATAAAAPPPEPGAVACAGDCPPVSAVKFVEGRGAHHPTKAVVSPPKKLTLTR